MNELGEVKPQSPEQFVYQAVSMIISAAEV